MKILDRMSVKILRIRLSHVNQETDSIKEETTRQ